MEPNSAGAVGGHVNTCQICLDDMTNRKPRALQCLHTFCEECIIGLIMQPEAYQSPYYDQYQQQHRNPQLRDQWPQMHHIPPSMFPSYQPKIQHHRTRYASIPVDLLNTALTDFAGRNITCPTCRQITIVPDNGIEGLPHNFLLKQVASLASVYSRGDLCQSCLGNTTQNRPASMYCDQCDRRMCDACFQSHSAISVYKKHQVQKYIPKQKKETDHKCIRHGNNVELFCKTCRSGICFDCAVSDVHKSHTEAICDLEEGSADFVTPITTLGDQITKKTAVVRSATTETRKAQQDFNQVSAQIKKHGEELKANINQQVDNLIAQLRKNGQASIQSALQTYDPVCKQATELVTALSDFLATKDPNQLIASGADNIDRGEEMLNRLKKLEGSAVYRQSVFNPGQKTCSVGQLSSTNYGQDAIYPQNIFEREFGL